MTCALGAGARTPTRAGDTFGAGGVADVIAAKRLMREQENVDGSNSGPPRGAAAARERERSRDGHGKRRDDLISPDDNGPVFNTHSGPAGGASPKRHI